MQHRTHHLLRRSALLLGLLALAAPDVQAQAWPNKPIRLIAASSAGGPPDVYARAMADFMGKKFNQPFVVDNIPAAGGMIAAQTIMRLPADGYALLVNTAGMMTITPNANPRASYTAADFTPICQGVEAALVLASHPSLGAKNFAELSSWIKNQKEAPSYSSYSSGSPAHFLGYQLSEALKVEMTHVPYRSSPPQITDMMGGVAPLGFVQIGTALQHIKAGKLVAYATTGERRAPDLPNVPTGTELGLPQLTTTVWFGFTAPKGLPPVITEQLVKAHQEMVATPEFQSRMAIAGLSASPGICGEAFLKKMNVETQRWARIVKATTAPPLSIHKNKGTR